MRKTAVAISLIFAGLWTTAFSQVLGQPEVGKPMPPFHFDNVTHYSKTEVSLTDYKGQWLILHFWFTGCVSSIKNLPEIHAFREKFRGRAEFLLVGINEEKMFFGKGIEQLFERLCEKQNLDIPSAYDSVLFRKWGIGSMPHIIIVDPQGIVRAITNGQDMTENKIRDLLDGKAVSFYAKDIERPVFNPQKGVPSNRVIYQSILAKWDGEKQSVPDVRFYPNQAMSPGYGASFVTLYQLYNLAYTGKAQWNGKDSLYQKVYPRPVLDLSDSTFFEFDYRSLKGFYNYNLVTREGKVDERTVMEIMQKELENIFGYEVSVEQRNVRVWKLIAQPDAVERLKTKGGAHFFSDLGGSGGAAGFTLRNERMSILLDLVKRYLDTGQVPFFDETGISHNIDITLDALMTDLKQIRAALQMNGIDLVLGKKSMNVLVIKDPKPE